MEECPGKIRIPRVDPPVNIISHERAAASLADLVKIPDAKMTMRADIPRGGNSPQVSADSPPGGAGSPTTDHPPTLDDIYRNPVIILRNICST